MLEIERKFIVPEMPEFLEESSEHDSIRQGYLAIHQDGSEIRVRDRNGDYFMTVKTGKGRIRTESEVRINETLFRELWPLTLGRRIEKRRFSFPYLAHVVELDLYEGDLQGLKIAEIEFPNETASDEFIVPEWVGQEVTDDPRFKNASLATNGSPITTHN